MPPHVHVSKSGKKAKIELGKENGIPVLIETWMNKKDSRFAWELVKDNNNFLLGEWKKYHG